MADGEARYSAGSIFLQVVPSFKGFEKAARAEARKMEDDLERALDDGSEKGAKKAAKNMETIFSGGDLKKAAEKAGRESGDKFSGEFEKALKNRVGNALEGLGKKGGEEVSAIRRELERLKGAKVGVDVDARRALDDLADVHARAERLAALHPDLNVSTNAKKVALEIELLHREVRKLSGEKINIDIDIDDKASRKLSIFEKALGRTVTEGDRTANSFRAINGILLATAAIGPALVPVLAAIAGGLLALGPAAFAAVSGLGVLGLSMFGIINAVKALNDVQQNAAKDQEAYAKKVRKAADAVSDAQKSLARARRDAAWSAEDSARRVRDAEQSAAEGVESALQRQEDAQKRLTQTVRDATQAQQDLRQARKDAAKDLEDVQKRQRQNAVDERQALIDVFNATVENNAAQADGGATNLDKEQASINLENARIRLQNIRDEAKELKDQKKKGIEGSDRVKNAEDAVTAALENQKKAQEDLLKASQDVNKARVEGARQVSDALEMQRRAAIQANESIGDAQSNLARQQQDYRDALFETGEVGSSSMQKLQQAMQNLGPAGRAFAYFIFSLKDDFLALVRAAQEGFLPGLQAAIQTMIGQYGPGLIQFVGTMGKVLGDLAKYAAQVFTGKEWQTFFGMIAQIAPIITTNFGKAFINFLTAFANIMVALAPLSVAFSEGLLGMSQAFLDWTRSKAGQKVLTDFLAYVEHIGPEVLDFFRALVRAFFALAKALAPIGELVLKGLTSLLNSIADMDPKALQAIVVGILALVVAFQLANIAAIALEFALGAFASPIAAVVGAIVILIGVIIYLYTTNETARKIIDGALRAIGAVASWLFGNWGRMIDAVAAAWGVLVAAFEWLWTNVLQPVFADIAEAAQTVWKAGLGAAVLETWALVVKVFNGIKWAWENILWPVFKVIMKIVWELAKLGFKAAFEAAAGYFKTLWGAIKFVWEKLLWPVFKLIFFGLGVDEHGKERGGGLVGVFRSAIKLISTIWDGLVAVSKKPIKFLIQTVLNGGLIGGFNWLANKLGMDKVDPIPLPKGFKRGGVTPYGVRPGYTPGIDTHLIAVGGGEAILRPELTRALGSDWVYAANARARTGGVQGAARFLQGFANGGVVPAWPVNGARVGTPFGKRGPMWSSGYHTGTDFPAAIGKAIHAVLGGKVSSTAWSSWGGNLTKIIVPGLGTMYYAHQSGQAVRTGQQVSTGQTIGYVGNTGNTTGPHLHLELRIGGTPVDPMGIFRGETGILRTEDKESQSKWDKLLGALGSAAGWVKDAVTNPLQWLRSKVETPISQMKEAFGDNWLTQGLARIPERFMAAMVDKIKGVAEGIFSAGAGHGASGPIANMLHEMAKGYGWVGPQMAALDWIVSKESSFNPNAQNPTSTAYGLFQFLDGTWAGYGPKTSDPRLQIQYGLKYIKDRYGDPIAAKAFHEAHGWYSEGGVVPGGGVSGEGVADNGTMMYDNGGYLAPGVTKVINLTGKPEPVFTAEQFERMGNGGGGGGFHYSPTFNQSDLTADDVAEDILFTYRRMERGGVFAGGTP